MMRKHNISYPFPWEVYSYDLSSRLPRINEGKKQGSTDFVKEEGRMKRESMECSIPVETEKARRLRFSVGRRAMKGSLPRMERERREKTFEIV